VVFPAGHGPRWWDERNESSPIPGLWPYGLEHLRDLHSVGEFELTPPTTARRVRQKFTGNRRRCAGSDSPDVALCWDERTAIGLLGEVKARRVLSGVIWATDQFAAGRDDSYMRLAKKSLCQFDALWCLSQPQIGKIRDWLGIDCPPVHYLTFGVDPTFYAAAEYPSPPLVASVGGDRDRDPHTLLAALTTVRDERPDAAIVVQSREVDAAPTGIELINSLPHVGVRDLVGRASVVAIATRPNWHASGMTVALEAMSIGRPVVACDTPGMADYISEETGILVEPGDDQAMASAVLDLLADPSRAQSMGAAGQRAVRERFNTTAMCREIAAMAWG